MMGVFFDQLKVYSVNYEALHAYAMDPGSFSAMRVLYTKFGSLMPAGERQMLARVIREIRPASDWKEWLDDDNGRNGGTP